MPAVLGVKLRLLPDNKVPPVAALNQLTISPDSTEAVKVGKGSPEQIATCDGATKGAVIEGHEQLGALTV